jgi:hypothetical protein
MFKRLNFLFIIFLGIATNGLSQSDSLLLKKNYNGFKYPDFVKAIELDLGVRLLSNSMKSDSLVIKQEKIPMYLSDVLRASFLGTRFSFYAYSPDILVVLDDYVIFDKIPGYFSQALTGPAVDSPKNVEFLAETKNLQKRKSQNYTFGIPTDKTDKRRAILSGHIVEAVTGETVIGATVVVEGLNTGVMADANGDFSIDLPQGRHNIVIRSIGTEEKKIGINLFANGKVNVELKVQSTAIDEVNVVANHINKIQSVQMGMESMEMKTIKALPSALGEVDIVKSATMLPGVQTVGECASGFNVRGGGVDQNLILLDGAPIFNSSHLFGFFSVFNQDVVEDFMLYKSGIPAKFGGRASSVLDVSSRNGNKDKYTFALGVSPITGRVYVEGPIINDRTTVLIAARSTYSDWLLKKIDDPSLKNSSASFWDGNVKIGHSINKNNKLKLSIYHSGDKFRLNSDTSYNYKNTCASLQWTHFFNNELSQESSLIYSNYWYAIESSSYPLTAFTLDYNIQYMSAETKFKYTPPGKQKFAFGFAANHYTLTPTAMHPIGEQSNIEPSESKHDNALDFSTFADDEWNVTDRFLVYGGLRADAFLSAGKRDVYHYVSDLPLSRNTLIDTVHYGSFSIAKAYFNLEPRLSFRYKLGRTNSLKASYNRMTQNLHMLSNSAAVSPTDSWTMSGEHIKPQLANIFSLGYYQNVKDNTFELSIETYYKRVQNFLDFKGGAQLLTNATIETDLLQGLQVAYGIEFLINKKVGNLTGWMGYTYSRSLVKMDSQFKEEQVNGGQFYPSNYDKPHDINFVANYKLNRRFSFSTSVNYSTGRPITYPVASYNFKGKSLLYYSERNEYRVPDYFRCDMSINIESNLKSKKIAHSYWSISIYNLTGRYNVYSVYFKPNTTGGLNGYQMSIFPKPILTTSYNITF